MRVHRLFDQAFRRVLGHEIGKQRRLADRAIDVEQRDVVERDPERPAAAVALSDCT
jgi:hypothetical protein